MIDGKEYIDNVDGYNECTDDGGYSNLAGDDMIDELIHFDCDVRERLFYPADEHCCCLMIVNHVLVSLKAS